MAEPTRRSSRIAKQAHKSARKRSTPLKPLRNASSRPKYRYEALSHSDSIRLVKICSTSPRTECKIKTVQLSDRPSYKALSYFWGPPGQLIPIVCNGRVFEVSSSLRDGLQRLHQYSESAGNGWFWIDQICINQEEGLERTHQVQLMNKIYSSSIRTVIWLPLDEPVAVASTALITDFHKHLVATGKIRANHEEREGVVKEVASQAPVATIPSKEDDRWPALKKLLAQPWFRRVWVIQEVALSTRPAMMLCGTQNLMWPVLYETIEWVYSHSLEVDSMSGMDDVRRLAIIGKKKPWDDGTDEVTWDLQSLLILSQGSFATVANDQVFALLGLCRDTQEPGNWPVELSPDYDRPQSEVFICVTRYCIRQNCNLNILQLADGKPGALDDGYPSWLLRLGLEYKRYPIDTNEVVIHSNHATLKIQYNYASADLHSVIDDTTAPEILRLRGTRVDTAILFCRSLVPDDFLDSSGNRKKDDTRLCHDIRVMLEFCEENLPHMPITELRRAFFLATTTGMTPEWKDAVDEPLIHFETFLGIEKYLTADIDHVPVGKPDPNRYAEMVDRVVYRRVFITSHGKIGIGPDYMEPNDIIAVLFGGRFPFVLRPKENGQWRFIGLCYIHGLMKGEALQGEGAKEENHEWFELV